MKDKNRIVTKLPMKEGWGTNKGKMVIDCQAIEGMTLVLEYENDKYFVEVLKYIKENRKFLISYKTHKTEVYCNNFVNKCQFGEILVDYKEVKVDDDNKVLTLLPFNGNRVNYQKMIGMTLKLKYKGEFYEIKIIDALKGAKLRIEHNGCVSDMQCSAFLKCQFGGVLNKKTKNFKVHIGEVFTNENRNLVILDREYRQSIRKDGKRRNDKFYKYKCNECGWEDGWIEENHLLRGHGCSCCTNRTVVENINSLWVTDRWLCDLGVSEEDAKKNTKSSGQMVVVTCPYCGEQKEISLNNLFRTKSIACSCGDGFSYGHKYVHSMLKQNNIDFQSNVTFDWCKFKDYKEDKIRTGEYDFVIEDTKMIIEVDGGLHRVDNTMSGQTKEESQYIDEMKDKLAREHGYEVIRIYYDDKKVEIKKYILNSEVSSIIDISNTNWLKCEEFALSNRVKEICSYYSNKKEAYSKLSDFFGLSERTIKDYLRRGRELGWCD